MASDASQSAPPKYVHALKGTTNAKSPKPPQAFEYEKTVPDLRCRRRGGQDKYVSAVTLCQYMWTHPTAQQTSLFFDVGMQPLYRYIKRHWGLTFDEFRDKNMWVTRHSLTQKALALALSGNERLLALALKNYCGWSGESKDAEMVDRSVQLRYSLAEPPKHPDPIDSPERDVTDAESA